MTDQQLESNFLAYLIHVFSITTRTSRAYDFFQITGAYRFSVDVHIPLARNCKEVKKIE